MGTLFNILIGLLMFMFLILIHEAGHFAVAKWSGIKVNEFSIGMGPKIKNWQTDETKYSLRALPIGGYVAMEGEEEDSEDPRSFNNSKPWKRFLTILAGPVMNFLLAILILAIVFMINGVQTTSVDQVLENSPAQEAGLQKGDRIVSINDHEIKSFSDISMRINENKDGENKLVIERDGNEMTYSIKAYEKEGAYYLGFTPMMVKNPLMAIEKAFQTSISIIVLLWQTLKGLISGALGLNMVSGPIGVISQMNQAVSQGLTSFLLFFAVISLNLAFFNILPIPALDGSKLLFIAIEKLIGRPLNKKFEQTITIIGFLFLLGLILLVSIKDVMTIFG